MTTILISVATGLVAGVVATLVLIRLVAPRLMIQQDASALSHDQAVEALLAAAATKGWKVPTVHRLDDTLRKAGFEVRAATVVELCRADYAAQILADETSRAISSMMPCRVAVYETANGSVVVSRMNTALMSRLFGGLIQRVMARASADSEEILGAVLTRRAS
jgi:uncharacterized protein (DUF302 family)